jgi:pyrroline-5-carboxylate reductase
MSEMRVGILGMGKMGEAIATGLLSPRADSRSTPSPHHSIHYSIKGTRLKA